MRFTLAATLVLALAPQLLAQPKGRKVAFLVGVGEYKFNFANLGTAPERDVTALAKTLAAGGFEVVTLTGTGVGAKRATKQNLEDRFARLLDGGGDAEKALGKHDLIMVHLCGHGYQVEAIDPATGKKEEQPFFCPLDAVPDKPETMVSLNGLIAATEPRGVTALFLIDACREAKDPNRGTRGGVQGNKVTLRKNTAVLFACGQGQLSHQSEKAGGGHGLFTHAVLETLKAKPDAGVSWSQLVSGVEQKFQSTEFRKMMPAGQAQNPVEAKGELGYTELLTPDPMAKDLQAVIDAVVFGGSTGAVYYKAVAPGRIAAWKKAAEEGSPAGMVLYADCLLNGTGAANNDREALAWYRKAEKAGSVGAKNQIGFMYSEGRGGVAKNYTEALRWYQEAANAEWTRSKLNVGLMHLNGDGTPKNEKLAAEWFRQAAKEGDTMAMLILANLLFAGDAGSPPDPRAAAELYRAASAKGRPEAKAVYGMVLCGDLPVPGVARDDKAAVQLFTEAAAADVADGHLNLAFSYALGRGGLPRDAAKYRTHLQKAADLGNPVAAAELKKLNKK